MSHRGCRAGRSAISMCPFANTHRQTKWTGVRRQNDADANNIKISELPCAEQETFFNFIYYIKGCARGAHAKAKKCRCGIQATDARTLAAFAKVANANWYWCKGVATMTRSDSPCVPTTEPALVVVTGRIGVAEHHDQPSPCALARTRIGRRSGPVLGAKKM